MKSILLNTIVKIAVITCLLAQSASSNAATVYAITSTDEISVGQTAVINIVVGLSGKEEASVFEGVFDIAGLDSVASAVLTAGGSSWSSSFGGLVNDQARVSLTSGNRGGKRLVATLEIVGLSAGTFDIAFNALTLAAFDIPIAPFLEDLEFDNLPGELLASVTVTAVPVPTSVLLLGSGLSVLLGLRRKGINSYIGTATSDN